METVNFLEPLVSEFRREGSVKNVYGDPITTLGKTIIPVAKISMGVGGGFGYNKRRKQENIQKSVNESNGNNEGGGMGGGLSVTAKGVYEVTAEGTKFIPANQLRKLLAITFLSFMLGRWVGKRNIHKGKTQKGIE